MTVITIKVGITILAILVNNYLQKNLFWVLHYHLQNVKIFTYPRDVKIKGGQNGTANF